MKSTIIGVILQSHSVRLLILIFYRISPLSFDLSNSGIVLQNIGVVRISDFVGFDCFYNNIS